MIQNHLSYYIEDPKRLIEVSVKEVQSWVKKYPFSQNIRKLYLQKLQMEDTPIPQGVLSTYTMQNGLSEAKVYQDTTVYSDGISMVTLKKKKNTISAKESKSTANVLPLIASTKKDGDKSTLSIKAQPKKKKAKPNVLSLKNSAKPLESSLTLKKRKKRTNNVIAKPPVVKSKDFGNEKASKTKSSLKAKVNSDPKNKGTKRVGTAKIPTSVSKVKSTKVTKITTKTLKVAKSTTESKAIPKKIESKTKKTVLFKDNSAQLQPAKNTETSKTAIRNKEQIKKSSPKAKVNPIPKKKATKTVELDQDKSNSGTAKGAPEKSKIKSTKVRKTPSIRLKVAKSTPESKPISKKIKPKTNKTVFSKDKSVKTQPTKKSASSKASTNKEKFRSKVSSKASSTTPQTFTAWLGTMDNPDNNEAEKTIKKKSKAKPKTSKRKSKLDQKASKSVAANEEIISESLAKLLAKQGYRGKAKSMYKKLALLFPEKSSYFASQLKKISKK